ncbi:hypothetical protein D3C85_1408440 [compost metagenome]
MCERLDQFLLRPADSNNKVVVSFELFDEIASIYVDILSLLIKHTFYSLVVVADTKLWQVRIESTDHDALKFFKGVAVDAMAPLTMLESCFLAKITWQYAHLVEFVEDFPV